MTAERVRGAVLYGVAFALLAAGAGWWVASAPSVDADPAAARWRQTVRDMLPDPGAAVTGDTLTLPAGADQDLSIDDVGTGRFLVAVACAGGENSAVRVRLGESGADTGRGLTCGGERQQAETFTVALGGVLRLNVSVSDAGPVVFGYTLRRDG